MPFVIVWTTVLLIWEVSFYKVTRLIQLKPVETARQDLVKGDRDRLIHVKITVIKGSNFRDYDNWPFNRGWPLTTGSTVLLFTTEKKIGTSGNWSYFSMLGFLKQTFANQRFEN